tara:strand:- start:651 stop:1202 length:552 start_codon:yes stop_codon:yes gene_type:complete
MLTRLLTIIADVFEIFGQTKLAERCWRKIAHNRPDAENLTTAGLICFKNGNSKDAEQFFLKALDRCPTYYQALFNLGFLRQNENRHHDAIGFLSKAIVINEKCDVAYYGRAQSFLQNGLIEKAIVDLKRTIEIQPFAPHAYYRLAHAYAKMNNLEKSKQIIQQLLTFEPQVGNQLKKELKLET